MQPHFSTIVTGNWLPRGVHTLESIKKYHPNATFSLLLLCEPFEYNAPSWLTIHWASYVTLEPLDYYIYTAYELSCAVRPKLILNLLQKYEQVWVVDSDIQFFAPLPVFPQNYDIYLTPHLVNINKLIPTPLDTYDILETLKAGIWNAGLVGYNNTNATRNYLILLSKVLTLHSHVSDNNTFYLDQSWYNLAPLYCNIYTIKQLGVNVGPWNLQERILTSVNKKYLVNSSEALIAFHFSSLQPHQVYANTPPASKEAITELITAYSNAITTREEPIGPNHCTVPQQDRKKVLYALQTGQISYSFIPTKSSLKKLHAIPRKHLPFFRMDLCATSNRFPLWHKLLHPIQALTRYKHSRSR